MRRRFRLRWRRVILLPGALAALALPGAALAGVHIQGVDTSGFPAVRATLVAPVGSQTPILREDGHTVAAYSVVNLGDAKAIVLAIDRSQSMRGRPFAEALTAAKSFVGSAGAKDAVGVVAFGKDALGLGSLSSASDAQSALDGLTVDSQSGTALYDAIVMAAGNLAADTRPGRAIVVVTDGADVSSSHSLADAIAAARAARAAVYTIGIGGPSFTATALKALAGATGGSYRQAARAADLATLYRSLSDELDRTWQLSYVTAARPGATIHLAAAVPGAGTAHTSAKVLGAANAVTPPSAVIPAIGYSPLGTVVLAALVGFIVLLACCFFFASRRGNYVRSRIEPHLGTVTRKPLASRRAGRAAARAQLSDSLERILGDLRQFKRVQLTIERADLPLRAGEMLTICAGTALVVGFFSAVLGAPALVTLLLMALFGGLPLGIVSFMAARRIKQFENQLPDMLITMAASLKAGHSFRQGLQSVVDEGADPAAKEFRRVLTETQLGKPMDDALADLADRVGSKNLTFVINAVTIQRQIGGSLAGLFDMVSDTVRQRQQFIRKVRGLTAMGRMSAYTLVGLPFFVGLVVTVMNPSYMSPMYHSSTGHNLLIGGALMVALGSALLKKIVSFKG